jgi:hypothetical protein
MPTYDAPCSASQKFDWETRFYQCLLLHHVELVDRASEAESILCERFRQAEGRVISGPEQEALNDAHDHLRKIQVLQLGFPAIDGEFVKNRPLLERNSEIDQRSRDLTGRPVLPNERGHLWKTHAA